MQPNGKWHIHDGTRPQPRVVTPGPLVSLAPPSDAIVLLGSGQDLGRWQMTQGGGPVSWPIENGVLSSGKGMIRTKQADFTDYQLHVEFATPSEVKGNSQGRGNSGVFLNGVFEIQVLDSFDNITYPDGQASAMYGQFPPMVNASKPPGEWQTYDILFEGPRWDEGGKLTRKARTTVLHNGVAVHHGQELIGNTGHRVVGNYDRPHPPKGGIELYEHGNPVRFRNIWIRELKGYDQGAQAGGEKPAAAASETGAQPAGAAQPAAADKAEPKQ